MSITEAEFKRLSEVRVEYSKNKERNLFEQFTLPEKKAVTNIAPDPLGKEARARINDVKEQINCHYDDDYVDPFFA